MFDIESISKRYFKIKVAGVELQLEPPKIKVLRKIAKLTKNTENVIEELLEALLLVLNKNMTGYKITEDFIEENFDTDEMNALLTVYFNWVGEAKTNPN